MVLSQEPGFMETVLATLYLRGGPSQAGIMRSNWPAVVSALRSGPSGVEVGHVLREKGFWAEALVVDHLPNLVWGREQVACGRCLCASEDLYPRRWIHALLGGAPPALWKRGTMPAGPYLGIVGSREIPRSIARWASDAACEAVRLGFTVISGGAKGCDRAAELGTRSVGSVVVRLAPYGLGNCSSEKGVCQLSVCAPDDGFSAANAMERNALIYAAGDDAVVVHARFRTGGTWTGAVDAQRRRLCRLLVREDPDSEAHRALVHLGAVPIGEPSELGAPREVSPLQRTLFTIG